MSTEDRKIGFYNFEFQKYGKECCFFDKEVLKQLLLYIDGLTGNDKTIRNEKYKKATSIETISINDTKGGYLVKIIFKSCKYNHNPKYMSSIDGSERNSNKNSNEGDKEKTHLCMRISGLEAKVMLEERRSGVTIVGIVHYLNINLRAYLKMINQKVNYKIIFGIIPTRNFVVELEAMRGVKVAEVFTYKKILGSEGLNLLEREDSSLKDDIVFTLKSNPRTSLLKRNLKNMYESIASSEESNISRVRIYGYDSSNNPIKLDSKILQKMDYIKAELDDDGTVNTSSIFAKMMLVLGDDDD
ncbi:MAG: hypothetical protein VB133_07575 [Anaeromusa sp.]|uniref:hypothetical protein n=1 Tax=Anaeromusa sp. TaxID=1872520 RepID=UPI002B204BDD|nr:hypothetical protein [Anaeromusa sp.]MEA4834976.1 hypothetical protein [Anaeromusa sp.]